MGNDMHCGCCAQDGGRDKKVIDAPLDKRTKF